ncbi:MAG: lipoprotein, partial [Erysipelotrichaceae bacterium]|nr:lipoprotein [Erysipelotrichaceae bacterium]
MKKMITALLALLMLAGCTPKEKPTEYAEMREGKTTYRYDHAV